MTRSPPAAAQNEIVRFRSAGGFRPLLQTMGQSGINHKKTGNSYKISQDTCCVNPYFTRFLSFQIDKTKKTGYDVGELRRTLSKPSYGGGETMSFGERMRERREELQISRKELEEAPGDSTSDMGHD